MKLLKRNLNEKGRKQVMNLHKELHRKVKKIMNDKKNRGDILCFSMGFTGVSQDKKFKETE